MEYRILIIIFLVTIFFSCSKKLSKLNSCDTCSEYLGDNFILDYPAFEYEMDKSFKYDGYVVKPRNTSSVTGRENVNGSLRIVDEYDLANLQKMKYCFIGLNAKQIEDYFSEHIFRTKAKYGGDKLELIFYFDYGDINSKPAKWYDYTTMTWELKKNGLGYTYQGSNLLRKHLSECKDKLTAEEKHVIRLKKRRQELMQQEKEKREYLQRKNN